MPPGDFVPLDPSDFSFFAFDGEMETVLEVLGRIGVRGGEPLVAIVNDAIFVPSDKVPAADRLPREFSFRGALVDHAGHPIAAVQSHRQMKSWGTKVIGAGGAPVTVEPEHEIDEEVVYLGWLFDHFGHFLLESLARTWFLDEVDPAVKVVFHTVGQPPPTGATRWILEAFGIPSDRMLALKTPTRLRRVLVPEPLYAISSPVHKRMPRRYREVAERLLGGRGSGPTSGQPVYLSRRLLGSDRRRIVGELELEEILRENGFLVAHPETMAFEDQVRLFNDHADILTTAGSAAHGVLFAVNRPALHILTAGTPREDYFLTPKVAGARAVYVNSLGRCGRPSVGRRTPLLADLPTIVAYLDQGGFLRKRLRASLAVCDPELRGWYDEAWLLAAVKSAPRGQALPPAIAEEARLRARTSWPLTWALAHHATSLADVDVDALARQFADLAANERDLRRLAQHHADLESRAASVAKRCSVATAVQLREVLANRFQIHLPLRRGRGASRARRRTAETT